MPSVAQSNPIPGIWPLGVLTVPAGPGAVIITNNVGTQKPGQTDAGLSVVMPQGRPYTSLVNELIFSAPSGNSGDIYVNYGNYSGLDTNATVLIVPKGTTQALPWGPLVGGSIDPNQYYISGANASDKVVVSAVYSS